MIEAQKLIRAGVQRRNQLQFKIMMHIINYTTLDQARFQILQFRDSEESAKVIMHAFRIMQSPNLTLKEIKSQTV